MEVYRFQGVFFVITDYIVTTLKQIITILLPLEESHMSATCRQVFEGMQHLSRFSLCYKKLDSSRVLFLPDGFIKIVISPLVPPDIKPKRLNIRDSLSLRTKESIGLVSQEITVGKLRILSFGRAIDVYACLRSGNPITSLF
ncbi:uncharacterized protein RSE6_02273 [Rhynchosporium secalis]|uniref:Uncharacterized protein n=1 Tax=Rhynchosporium secalis TaxID=38038 RepID=A0A1E1LZV5_RHYSE|nr:uncharacterized protein RSE6_02273 [Rhynchosporium secalis]